MEHHAQLVWLVLVTGIVAALLVLWFNDSSRKQQRIIVLEKTVFELQQTMVRCQLAASGVREMHETNRRLWMRMDRLQSVVQERGWRDSALLTSFDWRKPE